MRQGLWWNEFNQGQCVKPDHISDESLAAPGAEVTLMVDQLVRRHASIADYVVAIFIGEGLRSAFQVC